MIPSKKHFLQQLASFPDLKDNIIAYVFAKNPEIDISKKNTFFDNVKYYYSKYKEQKPEIDVSTRSETDDINEWLGKDLRIKKVIFKSLRGFPDSDTPFGIDFSNKSGEVQSFVILGGNATGKSSIYDALEYIYCNEIAESKLRSKTDFKNFLSHFDNGFNKVYCKIETKYKNFDIQHTPEIPENVRKRINPSTHFISDYDIYENGKLNYEENTSDSFHQLIAKSIGLESLLSFHKHIKSFILYQRRTERNAITTAEKNIKTQQDIITKTQEAVLEKQILLKSLEEKQINNIKEKDFTVILDILYKLKNEIFEVSFSPAQIAELLKEYKEKYNVYLSNEVKNYSVKEVQFLDLGLEILPEYDDCPFCLNSNSSHSKIEQDVLKRINVINEFRKTEQDLKRISFDLIDKLNNIFSQFKSIKSTVTKEIKEIKNYAEFNEVTQIQIDLDNYLTELIDNDITYEVSNLNENPKYLKNRYKYLFDLLEEHRDIITEFKNIKTRINNSMEKRNSVLLSIENNIKEKTKKKSITEQLIETRKEINDFTKQIENSKKIIKNEQSSKEKNERALALFNEIKESTKNYEKILKNKLNDIVNSSFAPIKMVVEEILKKFFEIDNRNFDIIISKEPDEYDEETGEVLSEIITAKLKPKDKNAVPQSIGVVLNTFHYRIFSTMVGIAIAIASRINTKINMPLVLDDIFYASDFENRATIETFLKALLDLFSHYTPDIPLQLIFFTHDQFIFESAMKVLSKKSSENIVFAKLYPPDKAVAEEGFKNILYKFPYYVTNEISNRILNII